MNPRGEKKTLKKKYFLYYRYGLRPLEGYKPDQVEYMLNNYYKFMFVRHPLERILSSYR